MLVVSSTVTVSSFICHPTQIHTDLTQSHLFSLFTLHIIVYLMLLFIQVFSLFQTNKKKPLQLQCIPNSTYIAFFIQNTCTLPGQCQRNYCGVSEHVSELLQGDTYAIECMYLQVFWSVLVGCSITSKPTNFFLEKIKYQEKNVLSFFSALLSVTAR